MFFYRYEVVNIQLPYSFSVSDLLIPFKKQEIITIEISIL